METINAVARLLDEGRSERVALEHGDATLTYGALREQVARAAGAWRELGLRPDERVIVFAPDSIDWVIAYLGVIWAGGVAIGVNPRLPMSELAPIAEESEVRYLWTDPALASPVSSTIAGLAGRPRILATGGVAEDWSRTLAGAPAISPVPRERSDAALWIGTSGTTGRSKGVIHTQGVTAPCGEFARQILGAGPEDRLYATSKLFFAYALANSLFGGLRLGASVVLDSEWPAPERVLEMVDRHRPTILFAVPTLYNKMLQTGVAKKLADYRLRACVSAGEALPPAIRRGWRDANGMNIVSGYGTSETLVLMLYSDGDDGLAVPTPLTEVRPRGDAGPGIPHRIWVRHPCCAKGYWRRPEAQADGFANGWYSPGDTFLTRADGRLEFAGRNDDMLKISGQWVSTLWIEQAILQDCGDVLQQVAATGVTTTEGLTVLAVLAVAADGREDEARRRVEAAIEKLPKHRRPRWVHWLRELPLTATGKLQRSGLRRLHEEALARAAKTGE